MLSKLLSIVCCCQTCALWAGLLTMRLHSMARDLTSSWHWRLSSFMEASLVTSSFLQSLSSFLSRSHSCDNADSILWASVVKRRFYWSSYSWTFLRVSVLSVRISVCWASSNLSDRISYSKLSLFFAPALTPTGSRIMLCEFSSTCCKFAPRRPCLLPLLADMAV